MLRIQTSRFWLFFNLELVLDTLRMQWIVTDWTILAYCIYLAGSLFSSSPYTTMTAPTDNNDQPPPTPTYLLQQSRSSSANDSEARRPARMSSPGPPDNSLAHPLLLGWPITGRGNGIMTPPSLAVTSYLEDVPIFSSNRSSVGTIRQALGQPMRPRERNLRGPIMATPELLNAILDEALLVVSDVDTSGGAEDDI
jgi:hypothetical protein